MTTVNMGLLASELGGHEYAGMRFYVRRTGIEYVAEPIKENLGHCYELAACKMTDHAGAILVHGSIQGVDLAPIGHAWVILPNGNVWEPAGEAEYTPEGFAYLFNAREHHKYTREEAAILMLSTGHFGTWE